MIRYAVLVALGLLAPLVLPTDVFGPFGLRMLGFLLAACALFVGAADMWEKQQKPGWFVASSLLITGLTLWLFPVSYC
ncbi:hypothetical protein C1Y63_04265 [Corynebacterium sp. 13CS0277]|uniref:hypothetical protein n=1 Tax=Corynebacterium sp. 13CS0277 TaxID=2071994 RepID=UPI000D046710|nr:hypothetical protein [Corynebacterium sp. 13CS0277]PRQ11860.1 hypothetical protein C1Y63_04265 [Corynebacterium sp. 13CS0277]